MPSDEDRAMTTGNMHKKVGKVRPCSFRVMQAHRQTDRQTSRMARCVASSQW